MRPGTRGALLAAMLCLAWQTSAATYPGIGRPATADEIAAWDIDVRADLTGLPPGSGSVAKGMEIWDSRCAACHGTFGESNDVFAPLVGGTMAEDIRTGRAKALVTGDQGRTTFMKLAHMSTLWDYVRRAMPWNAPKSLTNDEVYAVVAYMLNLADIVPSDFVLSNLNMKEVEARLPNRNGLTRDHGLGTIGGKPDVRNVACMKNCPTSVRVASALPDGAKDSHGNLAEQNRNVGPTRGAAVATAGAAANVAHTPADIARQHGCLSCHTADKALVGPAFRDIAARYKGQPDAVAKLAAKVRSGGSGSWGAVPMPAHRDIAAQDMDALMRWVLAGGI